MKFLSPYIKKIYTLSFWFFRSESDFGRLLKRLSEDSWKTSRKTSGNSSLRFMLEDFVGTLQEVFWTLMSKVVQILDMYSVCFKILKSYRFNLMWLFCLLNLKIYCWMFLYLRAVWMILNMQIFISELDFGRILRWLL